VTNRFTRLAASQLAILKRAIHPNRRRQQDKHLHVEAYDVRAHLIRVFGFANWDGEVVGSWLMSDQVWTRPARTGDKPRPEAQVRTVVYRVRYALTIYSLDGERMARYTEEAVGDAQGFPEASIGEAHDFALKTAESQALKRCAINLGDQFGLGLYGDRNADKPLVEVTAWSFDDEHVHEADELDRTAEVVVTEEGGGYYGAPADEHHWIDQIRAAVDLDAASLIYNRARQGKVGNATMSVMRQHLEAM
jgi:hypothetical protein